MDQMIVPLFGTREGNRPQSTARDAARGTVIDVNADTPLKFNTVPVTTGKTAGGKQVRLVDTPLEGKLTTTETGKCVTEKDSRPN